jgi:hypothetical protein
VTFKSGQFKSPGILGNLNKNIWKNNDFLIETFGSGRWRRD